MIKTFADRHTQELYVTGKSKRFPADIWKSAKRRLEYLDIATGVDDLKALRSNRVHALGRDRKGRFAIAINLQWRICFCLVDCDVYDVEITDYH